MPLGVEINNMAPALIASSGAALVQGIRQIGQQISGHITELQTKRDLGAIAQEMQGVNVQSNDFPVQLAQLISRHPMAARDERGKMLLGTLGQAHGQWQAGEAEARAFNRAMAMQGARDRSARSFYDYKRTQELGDPQNVGGALVVPRSPVTGQPEVLLPAPARAGSNRPITARPGDIILDPTGTKELFKNPKPVTASTSEARLQKKFKIDLLMKQDDDTRAEFGRLEKRRDALTQERMKITKGDDPNAAYLDNTIKAIEDEAKSLKERRAALQKAIEAIESKPAEEASVVEPELGPVPPGAVAPPVAAGGARIPVIGPDGIGGTVSAAQLEAALQNGYRRR